MDGTFERQGKPRVLVADKLSPAAVEIFRARGIEADLRPGLAPSALREIIGTYDGLAIRSATKVTRELLAAADRLRVVGRAGIGVDNVDVPAATARGVVVMNTPHGNAITTAEHAIAMLFALARQIPEASASTKAGKWEKNRFLGVEVTGKTLGVIGCGNIGAIVAERAQGLHMRVVAYDPYLSEKRALELGVEKLELDALLARADFVTLHVPLTEQTRNVISREAIARMKPGARLINCARGGLVDEAALHEALVSGHLAGAALDVFETEPATESPLFALENVVCTPHLGAATAEAQEKVALQVAGQMADFLLTGAVSNAVNTPSVSAEEAPRLRPYMALAQRLGALAGQLAASPEGQAAGAIRAIRVEYEGHAAELNRRPLTAAAVAGVLGAVLDSVNMVNAPVVARERDIEVVETTRERSGEYQTLLRVAIACDRFERTVEGTLSAGDRPRLVSLKGIAVEADFAPHMLYVTNQDRPGFIGRFGTALSEAGINIATFHLGRAAPGGDAVCLVAVDGPVPDKVLAGIRDLPLVRQATALAF
ncbi:phosphoglycerate dehydrogenase [Roseomonas sp. NAR14]|uniref:D-3-phosphoglycerate dehydrogenase n=1 Tax=Roseomonas acroporae TaxID=2937791 RepID=A0A9X1YBZ4_9PROT|nr:phosphoglycerate dehydrogenase [Roseomonas acroporae]MCK8785897.1 phosphoglycerate dehydrogenase [Roseomonas acroporae]